MGFYGNITNTSKTQFQFDKTFPNRTVMDRFIDNDGIFIGRFVLIEYDKQLTADWCSTAYLISDEYGVKHFFGAPDLSADSEFLYGDGNITLGKYIRVPGSFNDVNGNRVVYNLDDPANEKDILFLIVETEGRLVPPNVENKTETSQKDFYNENYNIDLNTYGGGRGYDSTVWQKVFKDGIERYVMVAELNSVVPSFAVSADAPTLSPVAPHFDADSTNVFYRVHWQPSWGLRVKSASPDISVRPINDAGQTVVGSFVSMSEKLDSKLPSDETTIWTRSAYDASTGKQINYYLNPAINQDTYKIIGQWQENKGAIPNGAEIPAAIYYNKAGFNSTIISYSDENITDKIAIEPTGLSGQRYNTHDGTGATEAQVDTQELSILLPSIGDSVAKMWDIVYGDEEVNGSKNRNTYIEWSEGSILPNTNGLRLITTDGTGYGYHPEQAETLAGAINSVFDLMGMIIQKKDNVSVKDITSNDLETWNNKYIYYLDNEKKFYKKHKTYKYNPENITDINKDEYFSPLEFSNWPDEGHYILDYAANNPVDTNGKLLPNFIKEKNYEFGNSYYQSVRTNYPITEFKGGFFEPYKFFVYKEKLPIVDEKENSILVNAYQTSLDKVFNKGTRYLAVTHEKLPDNTRFWTEQGEYYTAVFEEKVNPTQKDLDDGILFLKGADNKYYRPNTSRLDTSLTYYTPTSFSVESMFQPEKQYFTVSKRVQGNTVYIEQIQYLLADGVNANNFNDNIYYYKVNNEYYQADKYETGVIYYTKKSVLIQSEGQVQIEAKNIIEITLRNIDTPPAGGVYCYYHAKSLEGHDQYYILNKNNCSGLTNNLVVAYAEEVADIYEPNLYYYQITDNNDPFYGSYVFDTNDKPTTGRIYYSYDNVAAGDKLDFSVNPIYESNKYYYKDANDDYVLSTSSNYYGDREYYKKNQLYVISDDNLICPVGMEWNMNVPNVPEGVILGTRQDVWELKELEGFARHFNTIHGLILNTSNILETNNELVRDYDTVQGSINKLKDIFSQFGELYPNQIAVTDRYGRITTTTFTDDDWIFTDYNDKSNIVINHQYIGEETGKGTHTVNGEKVGRNLKFGEEFISPTFNFITDDMGHVNKFETSKVNLRIPTISYVDNTQGNVIVNMEMSGKDTSDITFTETRNNVGNLALTDYERSAINNVTEIEATDTINEAFDKINTLIDNLDYEIGDDSKYISVVKQEDGKVSAVAKDITTEIPYAANEYTNTSVTSPKAVHDYTVGVTDNLITSTTGKDETQYISYVEKVDGQLIARPKTIVTAIVPNSSTQSIKDVVSPKAVYDYVNTVSNGLEQGNDSHYISHIKKENGKLEAVEKSITTSISTTQSENAHTAVASPLSVYNYVTEVSNGLVDGGDTYYISAIGRENGKLQIAKKEISTVINNTSTHTAVVSPKAVQDFVVSTIQSLDVDKVGNDNSYINSIEEIDGKIVATSKTIATEINESSSNNVAVSPKAVHSYLADSYKVATKNITDAAITNDKIATGIDSSKSVLTNYEAVKNTEWYVSLGLITEDTFNSYIAAGIPLYVKGATEDSYVSSEVYNIDNIYYKKTGWNNSDINNYALSNSDNLTDAVVKLEYRMNKALDTINMSGMKKLEGENIDTTIINTDTLGEVISKLIYRIEQLEAKINESGS